VPEVAGPANDLERAAFVQALARGDSLPAIARRVVLGAGGLPEQHADARDRADYAGRALLGMRIGCARCHDHPSDRWRRRAPRVQRLLLRRDPTAPAARWPGSCFDTRAVSAWSRASSRSKDRPRAARAPRTAPKQWPTSPWGTRRFSRNACNRVFAQPSAAASWSRSTTTGPAIRR
jgi:hypothetical protein